MERGEKVVGCFFGLDSVPAVEILGDLGMDFIMIDTEHGPYDVETAARFVMACESHGMTPMVRVKDYNRNSILKMLDIGSQGILVPFVKTVEQVKEAVGYGKYRPVGDRGFGPGRAADFAVNPALLGDLQGFFDFANKQNLIIPQCETAEALACIEEIVSLEGVDGIFIGPFDLSVSMGIPKQFKAPEFLEAIAHVLDVCHKHNKFCWILSGSPEDAKAKFEQGFDGVLGMDVSYFYAGASAYINGVKAAAES